MSDAAAGEQRRREDWLRDLNAKNAVVTGASRGLGAAIAEELVRGGMNVVLTARTTGALEALASRLSGRGVSVLVVPADVTDAEDRAGIVDIAERKLGSVHLLVNAAGIARAAPFVDQDPPRVIATNLTALIELARLVVPQMLERATGHMLNVASLAGRVPLPYLVDYSASKAGLVAFSLALREELLGSGVSTTAVSPGFMVDRGMCVSFASEAPRHVGRNMGFQVARRAVRAIRRNEAEVTINRLSLGALLPLGCISAGALQAVTRVLGFTRFVRGLAEEGLPHSDAPRLVATRRDLESCAARSVASPTA